MRQELIASTHPETRPENMISGKHWRISVLTESLLRLEYSPDGPYGEPAPSRIFSGRDLRGPGHPVCMEP